MSRLASLLSTVKFLPASPLRPTNSHQLSDGLASIITRAFPGSSSSSSTSSTSSTSKKSDTSSLDSSPLAESTLTASDEKPTAKTSSIDQSPLAESTLTPSDEGSSSASDKGSGAGARDLGPSEEKALDGMKDAIEKIKSNFALERYPLTDKTLRPPSDPLYYKRIMDGVHLSSKGVRRSWWKLFFQVKGEA